MKRRFLMFLTLMLITLSTAWAQSITVKGRVLDETGQPVAGATVRLKATPTKGTATNLEGRFTLVAKQGEILLISFVGYHTQEVVAKPTLLIRMETESDVLDEVVVVGYGSGRAIGTTTASVVKVSAKELESKPTANVLEGLQGKVAGMDVSTSSGEPGQLASIKIHGHGSLGLGSAPMYILDGVPVGQGTILGLNPNDFESVQVLKDAAATAIYGSRASNGVIFVTTKRGQAAERATITLTSQYGVSNLASRKFYDDMLSADELEAFWIENGIQTKEFMQEYRKKFPHDYNWTDYFYRKNAPTYNASLSMSGGSNKMNYYVSGQHFFQQGLFAGKSEYRKSNLRSNLSFQANKWLSIVLNNGIYYDSSFSANTGYSNNRAVGLFFINQPFWYPYKEDGSSYIGERIPGINIYDVYYVEDMYNSKSSTFEYLGNLGITIRPFKGFSLRSNIGLDFQNSYSFETRDPRAAFALNNGSRYEGYSRGIEWTFTNTAEYRFNLEEKHDFTFLLGHEYNQYVGNSFSASGSGIKDHRLMHFSQVTDPEKKSIGSSFGEYAYLSYFGRFSYGLLNRYYIDATVRNDASSKFPERHRNATFWSIGAKWNAKKEVFLDRVNWVDRLDVKLSTGTAGNSSLTNYAYWATSGASDPYLNEPSRVITSAGNPDLTWETQQKTTLGIDFWFLQRFGINLELYDRRTTGMVMSVPYPYTSGITTNTQNVGTYQNRGMDFRLDINIWRNHGNRVDFYTNLNYNRDKVLKLFQGHETWPMPKSNLTYIVGEPVMFYMPIFKQVNPDTGDPEWYNPGEDPSIKHIDENDYTVGNDFNKNALQQNTGIARNIPWRGGFGLSASYEGFYMQADFAFFIGKHMINNDLFFTDNPMNATNRNTSHRAMNFWKKKGDNVIYPSNKYKRFIQFDTRMLLKADYLRMKNFTVGYEVPRQIIQRQKFFTGAKFSITGRNLLTATNFIGADPEPDTNLTYGMNPATKQLIGTIELKF